MHVYGRFSARHSTDVSILLLINTFKMIMEKYMQTPVKNSQIEDGSALVENNTLKQTDVDDELEVIHEKIIKKSKPLVQVVESRNIKIKKLKVKRSRGVKRKFPEKFDSKKFKKKKKEEKSGATASSSSNNISEKPVKIEVFPHDNNTSFTPQHKSELNVDFAAAENGTDMKNGGRPVQKKIPKKRNKAIAVKCKETLDILLKLGLEVLDSMDKSLKLIRDLSLLNDKYISIDILLDLISLAVDISRTPEIIDLEKELSLSMIITKCINKLNLTPKRSKARQSIAAMPFNPQNASDIQIQEEVPVIAILEEEPLENQNDEETEQVEAVEIGEVLEKTNELTLEKSGSNFCITKYFKKLKRTVDEKDKDERFSSFSAKADMFLAPKLGGELTGERREKFEEEFNRQNYEFNSLLEHIRKYKPQKKSRNIKQEGGTPYDAEDAKELPAHSVIENIPVSVPTSEIETLEVSQPDSTMRKRVSLIRVEKTQAEPVEAFCRTKAKLFQFHDNRRPPYWGTWRKKSESVKPRRPFGKEKMFNYEIDSDDEWEEEEEPGESLHGSDDEKEPEEDYEVDNEFFVPHGYLSDDENPEKENLSPKTKLNLLEEQFTSEQKQKMKKMAPIVFGTYWMHKGLPSKGNLYQDLQIDKLQYVPWTTIPVEIEEEEDAKKSDNSLDQGEPTSQIKKFKRKIFPDEEIPNLIKMIHGSPQNAAHLARKFLLHWKAEKISNGNSPEPTKICVQKKIKELAAWQASDGKGKMCWQVPMETRKEFGADVENKTPEKKPQKCFIWKFVRKAEKNTLPGGENPSVPTPIVEPEVVSQILS